MNKFIKKIIFMFVIIGMSVSLAETISIVLPFKSKINGSALMIGEGYKNSGIFIGISASCILSTLYYVSYNRMAISHNIKTGVPFSCELSEKGIIVNYEK